jgi:hypothetical protein
MLAQTAPFIRAMKGFLRLPLAHVRPPFLRQDLLIRKSSIAVFAILEAEIHQGGATRAVSAMA